jgi:RNA polymerase sigma-54 factor
LSQIPRQALQQQQRLTPQQIQSLNILQLDLLSLESRIEQELDSNPALEIVPTEPEAGDNGHDRTEKPAPEREEALVVSETDNSKDFERLDNLVSEYGSDDDLEYRGTRSRASLAEEGDSKLEAMANTPSRPVSLQEFLNEQWILADVNDRIRAIGTQIIDSLATNGRLETPLADIAVLCDPPATEDEMIEALSAVQELEPAGIASRSIQECLLIQLNQLPGENRLERRIILEHLEDLERNRLPKIAAALDVDLDEVKGAIHIISRLRVNPASAVVENTAPTIMPDVIIEYNDREDAYDVRLARGNTRELRISPEFREAIKQSRDDKQTREFLKQKIDAAKTIIDAVKFRRERLLDVARAVVRYQREFLDEGEQHLRVLRMSDLAEELGCDPSTVSRTVDEKYVQTPRGVYPLRRFFTGGTASAGGEEIGWDSIKAKVREIVDNEDKAEPLNDDQIVDALAAAGINIKRRTVAKYRQQLDIPTARQRRQY